MPSSTSNFERPVPAGSWFWCWGLTLPLVIACLVCLELFARSLGYRPSVRDDAYLWSWWRGKVANDSSDTLAILGTSRSQLGFSMFTLRDAVPDMTVVQLSVNGKGPAASVMDLGEDPQFRGLALVDMAEWMIVGARWDEQQPWVDTYHRRFRTPGASLERVLALPFQASLALFPATGRRALLSLVDSYKWPPAPYIVTRADRSRSADYRTVTTGAMNAKRKAAMPRKTDYVSAEVWRREVAKLGKAVAAIKQRGGQVVFLRMPTTGKLWETSQQRFPRTEYWNHLAELTGAHTLHFEDFPELRGFHCPDWSHIDKRAAPEFTRRVVKLLRRSGVLPEPAATGAR